MRYRRGEATTGCLAGCAGLMLIVMLVSIGFYGFFGQDNALVSPTGTTFASGETFTGVEATAYVPDWKEKEVGVNCDKTGGVSIDTKGKRVEVLSDFIAKKAPYVSIAIDSKILAKHGYGTKARMPELEKMFNNGAPIEFRLVDTFAESKQGAGYMHVDIAVDCEMLGYPKLKWTNPRVTLIIDNGGSGNVAPFDCNGKKFVFPIVTKNKVPINSTHHDYSANDIFVMDGKTAVQGDTIVSITDGVVASINKKDSGNGGVTIRINDRDNISYYYAHMQVGSNAHLSNGQSVKAGETIGRVGKTGNARSTPPHLHLGIANAGGPQTKGYYPSQHIDNTDFTSEWPSSKKPLSAWQKGTCADPKS